MIIISEVMKSFSKIKENYLFRRAYSKGNSIVTPYAVIYVLKNKGNNLRLGITAGKKIGKAVARNRAKRVILAAFRSCMAQINGGYDFVIVARQRILTVKSTAVAKVFLSGLEKGGYLKG